MLQVHPVRALQDNYIWLITAPEKSAAIIVDPGEAVPVITALNYHHFTPIAIFITHHHGDHTNGVPELAAHYSLPVYGPAHEPIPMLTHPISEKQKIFISDIATEFTILNIPGHTRDHVAYYGDNKLFCGDTLFTGGCGRIFEGTPVQLYQSLQKLKQLPEQTEIYCGHEYTQANLYFAQKVEPNNKDLLARIHVTEKLRRQNFPTVPASLAIEKRTNPFLRCDIKNVIQAVEQYAHQTLLDPVMVFTLLREWKNTL